MCEPTTILMVGSLLMTAYASNQEGSYQRKVGNYNARVAENEAQETRNVANEAENIQRQRTAELVSKQRAQLASANVDLNFGSAAQLQEDAQMLGEADALRIRSNFDQRVDALNTQAVLTRAQGAGAKAAGRNKAAGSLLSAAGATAGGVSDKWYNNDSAAVTSSLTGGQANLNYGGYA